MDTVYCTHTAQISKKRLVRREHTCLGGKGDFERDDDRWHDLDLCRDFDRCLDFDLDREREPPDLEPEPERDLDPSELESSPCRRWRFSLSLRRGKKELHKMITYILCVNWIVNNVEKLVQIWIRF